MIIIQTNLNISSEENNTVKKPPKWSYSKLGCFEQCGFKYKLKYVDKNFSYSGSIATEFGTAIHHAEESIANYIKDNNKIDYIKIKNRFIIDCQKIKYKYINDWFEADKYSGKTYDEKYWNYLESGIFRLEHFMASHPEYEISGAEVPVDFMYLDKYRFTGAIDRLLYNKVDGSYIIQDIKSWPRIEEHKDDLPTPLQFVVYSLALAQMKGISTDLISCQYDLPISGEIADAGTKGYIKRGQTKLNKLFESIEGEEFTPSPGMLCHWCEFCHTNEKSPEKFKWLCPYASIWTKVRPIDYTEFEFTNLGEYNDILTAFRAKHNIVIEPTIDNINKKEVNN